MASATVAGMSLDDLERPLHQVVFVVLDLETTGGSPEHCRVTEIGAVKVCGGEVLGTFHTLVDPDQPIPAGVSGLTGITDPLVAGHPPMEAALPSLIEFLRGTAIVAHNARFDTAFLNANLTRLDYPPLELPVVCTATLARRLVAEEVRDCTLTSLARHFGCAIQPTHRAFTDAQATVEVFHRLLERAGSFGVLTLEDLISFARLRDTPLFAARRWLADGLPHQPGVYALRSTTGEVLYVGTAGDLRSEVRGFFGGDQRRWITAMLREAVSLNHWVTPTPLEARVRRLRLLQAHRPRFNRRAEHPPREVWIKLHAGRLSLVRRRRPDGATYLGPLRSRRAAEPVVAAVHEALGVGRAQDGQPSTLVQALERRMRELAAAGCVREAARTRRHLDALTHALRRGRRLAAAAASPTLVVSRPSGDEGMRDVVLTQAGRLVATRRCSASHVEREAARLLAEHHLVVADPLASLGNAVTVEDAPELAIMAEWLDGPGARVHAAG